MNCTNCNHPLPEGSKFCQYCGRLVSCETPPAREFGFFNTQTPPVSTNPRPRTGKGAVIVLAIILILSFFLNVGQFLWNNDLNDQLAELKDTVSSLNDDLDEAAPYKKKAGYYDDILKALRTGSIGRASNSFSASDSIILLNKTTTDRKFTLYTTWNKGATIEVDHSGTSAAVSFDNTTWYDSTTLTVMPKHEGITAVTFSNDLNPDTFTILIIVVP